MTVFDKARELGALICDTDEAIARAEAMERFLQDEKAVEIMKNYEDYQRDIESRMQKGTMTQEQFAAATEELKRLGTEVKAHPVTGSYVEAVNSFNKLINQVFHIVHSVAWGQMDGFAEDGCGCGGGNGHECGCTHGCAH